MKGQEEGEEWVSKTSGLKVGREKEEEEPEGKSLSPRR